MSDATNRPSSSGEAVASAPPTPPQGAEGPAWSAPAETGGEAPYRPVSVSAILGLALAVIYAVLVSSGGLLAFYGRFPRAFKALIVLAPLLAVVGAALARERRPARLLSLAGYGLIGMLGALGMFSLVAFSASNPWLVPGWTIILPVVACLVSWLARVKIQKSEGTLDGLKLTTWGLGLSLVFGLNYTAYQASTFLAVRQQANEFARDWIEEIKKGNVSRAFVVTRRPSTGASQEPVLPRGGLELQYNSNRSDPRRPGDYSAFAARDYVRLIVMGGEQTQVEIQNVDWRYEKGAYDVTLVYKVTTPADKFSLQLQLRSTEPEGKSAVRKWQVNASQTGMALAEAQEVGPELPAVRAGAGQVAQRWVEALRTGDLDQAYLQTLPPAERQRQAETLAALREWTSALPLTVPLLDLPASFVQGTLVREDGKYGGETFWAPSTPNTLRAEVVRDIKKLFQPGTQDRPALELQRVEVPLWKRDGKKARALLSAMVNIPWPQAQGMIVCEGSVVVEADAEGDTFTGWRVLAFELERAHIVTRPQGPGAKGLP